MADAYIVDAARTPTGRRKGGLADVHGADLGAHVLKALVDRKQPMDVVAEWEALFASAGGSVSNLVTALQRLGYIKAKKSRGRNNRRAVTP